jgi:hypothetical protein
MSGTAPSFQYQLCTNPFCQGLLKVEHWHFECINPAFDTGAYVPQVPALTVPMPTQVPNIPTIPSLLPP